MDLASIVTLSVAIFSGVVYIITTLEKLKTDMRYTKEKVDEMRPKVHKIASLETVCEHLIKEYRKKE